MKQIVIAKKSHLGIVVHLERRFGVMHEYAVSNLNVSRSGANRDPDGVHLVKSVIHDQRCAAGCLRSLEGNTGRGLIVNHILLDTIRAADRPVQHARLVGINPVADQRHVFAGQNNPDPRLTIYAAVTKNTGMDFRSSLIGENFHLPRFRF